MGDQSWLDAEREPHLADRFEQAKRTKSNGCDGRDGNGEAASGGVLVERRQETATPRMRFLVSTICLCWRQLRENQHSLACIVICETSANDSRPQSSSSLSSLNAPVSVPKISSRCLALKHPSRPAAAQIPDPSFSSYQMSLYPRLARDAQVRCLIPSSRTGTRVGRRQIAYVVCCVTASWLVCPFQRTGWPRSLDFTWMRSSSACADACKLTSTIPKGQPQPEDDQGRGRDREREPPWGYCATDIRHFAIR